MRPKLERKEFGYSYGSTGYMIYFHERPIGGGGIKGKGRRGNIKMFGEYARATIDGLLRGDGDAILWTNIAKILGAE